MTLFLLTNYRAPSVFFASVHEFKQDIRYMLKKTIRDLYAWYTIKRPWWPVPVLGLLFALALPPFNHRTHPLLLPFPFLSFFIVIPLCVIALEQPLKRAAGRLYLFGIAAALSQYYWISNVVAEGLWHMIMIGLGITVAIFGAYYLALGLLFRLTRRVLPRMYILVFPAVWITAEYLRGFSDIAFPWAHLGYTMTPVLPLAQTAWIWGVFGISFLIVLGNMLFLELIQSYAEDHDITQKWIHVAVFGVFLLGLGIWGWARLQNPIPEQEDGARVSVVQPNFDPSRWGSSILDSALAIDKSLIMEAAEFSPDLIVLPESAVFAYLARKLSVRQEVQGWADSAGVPIILGSLHWERSEDTTWGKYRVYNTSFLVRPDSSEFGKYFKMRLVPGSEYMPFSGVFPILSRLNLGSANFAKGREHTVFSINERLKVAPFICYEMIFPGLVRQRVRRGANLLVNVTNDGWFGRSTAPYHHAAMATMRCIENGVSMARSANTGISMFADQYGRTYDETPLYTRTIRNRTVSRTVLPGPYTRFGDWPVYASILLIVMSALMYAIRRVRS